MIAANRSTVQRDLKWDWTFGRKRSSDEEQIISALGRSMARIDFDLKGNVLWANENFIEAIGYRLDEIVGKHHAMFVPEKSPIRQNTRSFGKSFAPGNMFRGLLRANARTAG